MTWKSKVYKRQLLMSREERDNWEKTRRFILNRDLQTCVRCDKFYRARRDLSVHHITPRADGGTDDPSNLITLCHKCHDFVEVNNLRTIAAIMGSFDDGIIKTISTKDNDREESFTRPEWHKFVYGGQRHNA